MKHDQGGAAEVRVSLRVGELCITQLPSSGDLGTSVWDASVILVREEPHIPAFEQSMPAPRVVQCIAHGMLRAYTHTNTV
jgi:hypothetical protein